MHARPGVVENRVARFDRGSAESGDGSDTRRENAGGSRSGEETAYSRLDPGRVLPAGPAPVRH